jgi:hypothetical protein
MQDLLTTKSRNYFMKKLCFTVSIFIIALVLNSCYYDKADLLYPPKSANCDTTIAVTYSAKVVPILTTQCYSCHLGASAGGGIVMGTHATDKVIALNGKLYGTINYSSGFSPMPKGGAKMNTCDIGIIKRWIDAGAPNN